MIDIRDYIISSEKLPNDSGFIFKPENSYVIENGSNVLLKIKEYSKGIIRCENGSHFCIFEDDEVKKFARASYNGSSRHFMSINKLQKSKYYKRKKFFEDFE